MTIIDPIAVIANKYDICEPFDMMIALQAAFKETREIDGSGYSLFTVPEHILGQVAEKMSWLVRVKMSGEKVSEYVSKYNDESEIVYMEPPDGMTAAERQKAGEKYQQDQRYKFKKKLEKWEKLSVLR